jgi:hypothetical protein
MVCDGEAEYIVHGVTENVVKENRFLKKAL